MTQGINTQTARALGVQFGKGLITDQEYLTRIGIGPIVGVDVRVPHDGTAAWNGLPWGEEW